MSVTETFVMSAVVVLVTAFCFVATRYSMFSDEKPENSETIYILRIVAAQTPARM